MTNGNTMEQHDIRWKQRFQNFDKAFSRLEKALPILSDDPDNFLLQAGVVQIYEFTFELAWKTLKDYVVATEIIKDIQSRYYFLLKDLHAWLKAQM